jgi:hypothetical protein
MSQSVSPEGITTSSVLTPFYDFSTLNVKRVDEPEGVILMTLPRKTASALPKFSDTVDSKQGQAKMFPVVRIIVAKKPNNILVSFINSIPSTQRHNARINRARRTAITIESRG